MLSAAFSILNARLSMPPFSLFVVALTLADGMCRVQRPIETRQLDHAHFYSPRNDLDLLFQRDGHWYIGCGILPFIDFGRILAGDWAKHRFLLYHFCSCGRVASAQLESI
jgi:hypothetical protein